MLLDRRHFAGQVDAALRNVDVMLIPAQPIASPSVQQMATLGQVAEQLAGLLAYTAPFDMSGHPSLTLPAAYTAKGLPVAIRFIANRYDEMAVCRAGRAFQDATNWHRRHPGL